MNNLEPIAVVIFLIFWAYWMIQCIRFYRITDKLFVRLATRFPDYYESIGKPRFNINPIRNFRAQRYLGHFFFSAAPAGLPNDKKVHVMAKTIHRLYTRAAIMFLVAMAFILIWSVYLHKQDWINLGTMESSTTISTFRKVN